MKILAITSRDYYDIVDLWDKSECTEIANFISQLNNGEIGDYKYARKFFLQEASNDTVKEKCVTYWDKHRNESFKAFRKEIQDVACIYIIPCIPRDLCKAGQLCEDLKIRQDFIGIFIKYIERDVLSRGLKIDKFSLACHEADIFSVDEERGMHETDVKGNSFLKECIDRQLINVSNIYGYQHENKAGSLYHIFNGKLAESDLSLDIVDDIYGKIDSYISVRVKQTACSQEEKTIHSANSKIIVNRAFVKVCVSTNNGEEVDFSFTDSELHQQDSQLKSNIKKIFDTNISGTEIPLGNYSFNVTFHEKDILQQESLEHHHYIFCQDSFCSENSQLPLIHFCNCSLDEITKYYRYANIMDSSIWNFFIRVDIDNSNIIIKESEKRHLIKILEIIKKNYQRNLYDLAIEKEYADLNARITYNSYITSLGPHGDYVAPFVFHSENWMKHLICEELINTSKIRKICSRNWRILLVDDKAETKLSPFTACSDNVEIRLDNKLKIIKYRLVNLFHDDAQISDFSISTRKFESGTTNYANTLKPNGSQLVIEYVENIEDAQRAMNDRKYDIVLLDYLLDECETGRHYGYDILNDLFDNIKYSDEKKEIVEGFHGYKYGPANRFFFMFISAYSSAVHDRLLAEGLNLSEDYWHISIGGCPTNTPQLFLYHLLKMMDKRLEDSGILKLSSDSIYKLTNKIYRRKEDDPKRESVRKRANAHYQEVLSLQYHYRSILRDVEIPFGNNSSTFDTKGSVLMTDFIQKKVNLGGMLEHLTQLVHLTAFGTIRQWLEMWEEYIYFKAMFEKQLDEVSSKDFNTLCQNIENYILELKSRQQ